MLMASDKSSKNPRPEEDPRHGDVWTSCPRCGKPLLIDPKTGEPEPCASCRTSSSLLAVAGGVGLIVGGIALIAALVGVSIAILL